MYEVVMKDHEGVVTTADYATLAEAQAAAEELAEDGEVAIYNRENGQLVSGPNVKAPAPPAAAAPGTQK